MPTRLIEIGDFLRLVDSAALPTRRYAALSHCWGKLEDTEKFCASRNNIRLLEREINFDKLPPTFKDAVTVTRGLGIGYIWIDSICIIQDDEKDWQREASRMEQVFSDAYVTIGASSARSSLDGFLHPRVQRESVVLSTQDGGQIYICPFIDDFHKDVELGPLNQRGWVLQERALSRRMIHYTSSQMYWECGAGIRCETLAHLLHK